MMHYVYVFFRPDGSPCYVGMGKGGRWKRHVKNARNPHLKQIFDLAGGNLPVVMVREGMPVSEALALEAALIKAIGRLDTETGPLVNLTDGGEYGEGVSDATRAKISAAMRGRTISPEWRAKISAARKGTKASAETRAKLSTVRRGKPRPPSFAVKMSAKLKGREFSPEWRARLSAAQTGKVRSPEFRAKQSVAHKGRAHTRDQLGKFIPSAQRP